MALPSINPTKTAAWSKLKNHFEAIQNKSLRTLFDENPNRANEFHIEWEEFLLDFSKNIITKETLGYLVELAEETQLKSALSSVSLILCP